MSLNFLLFFQKFGFFLDGVSGGVFFLSFLFTFVSVVYLIWNAVCSYRDGM